MDEYVHQLKFSRAQWRMKMHKNFVLALKKPFQYTNKFLHAGPYSKRKNTDGFHALAHAHADFLKDKYKNAPISSIAFNECQLPV